MSEILEIYKKEMTWYGNYDAVHSPISNFFNGFRVPIPSEAGKGWNETLEIDSGLCLSLSDYLLDKTINNTLKLTQSPLRFNILLNGSLDFRLDSTTKHTVYPGDIWVWNDLTGNISRTMHPKHKMRGVTLTFPHHLLASWMGNASCDVSRNLEKLVSLGSSRHGRTTKPIFLLTQRLPQANQIMCMARELFRFEKNTLYGKLHFESQALEFLCGLLSLDFGKSRDKITTNWKIKMAVDDAVDILCEEWANPPSISALARRVNTNEFYLKHGFRTLLGYTIGEFVRQKRMEKAMELIESGKYSMLEIALFVGYANPSHFAAVFKKKYGHAPSYYARLYHAGHIRAQSPLDI